MYPILSDHSPMAQFAELNRLFLRVINPLLHTGEMVSSALGRARAETARRVLLELGPREQEQLARAPVALFRLRLEPAGLGDRVRADAWLAAESHDARMAFTVSAMLTAWHMLQTAPDWARLGFGLSQQELTWLAGVPLSELPVLAVPAAERLRPRFVQRGVFWQRVAECVARGDREGLRLVRYTAIHLASAEQHV